MRILDILSESLDVGSDKENGDQKKKKQFTDGHGGVQVHDKGPCPSGGKHRHLGMPKKPSGIGVKREGDTYSMDKVDHHTAIEHAKRCDDAKSRGKPMPDPKKTKLSPAQIQALKDGKNPHNLGVKNARKQNESLFNIGSVLSEHASHDDYDHPNGRTYKGKPSKEMEEHLSVVKKEHSHDEAHAAVAKHITDNKKGISANNMHKENNRLHGKSRFIPKGDKQSGAAKEKQVSDRASAAQVSDRPNVRKAGRAVADAKAVPPKQRTKEQKNAIKRGTNRAENAKEVPTTMDTIADGTANSKHGSDRFKRKN